MAFSTRYTAKELQSAVDSLNNQYCKKTKNELYLQKAYGGYQVQITGKKRKDGRGFLGMGSARKDVTCGFQSVRDTMTELLHSAVRGDLKSHIDHCEKISKSKSRYK